jgi:hypothetical protein
MADLYHVVLKDHENSGYVWDEFFCPTCLEKWVTKSIIWKSFARPWQARSISPAYIPRL